jgi:sortase (surface protein transpeptidase)
MHLTVYHIYKPTLIERYLEKVGVLLDQFEPDNVTSFVLKIVDFVKSEYRIQKRLARGDWYIFKNLVVTNTKRLKHKVKALRTNTISATKGEIVLQKTYYATFAKLFAAAGIVMFIIAFAPSGWYFLSSRLGIERNTKVIADTVKSAEISNLSPHKISVYQPVKDSTLPQEPRLIVSTAGIDTRIYEATEDNYEEALKKGVWRVNNFGTPYEREKPIILAAHRFGYLKWSIPYRLKNSFYNLPKTQVGDTVEIIWNQRKYTFAIYAEEEGEAITDYSADLILYTCKDLESDVRLFKYAKLIEI